MGTSRPVHRAAPTRALTLPRAGASLRPTAPPRSDGVVVTLTPILVVGTALLAWFLTLVFQA